MVMSRYWYLVAFQGMSNYQSLDHSSSKAKVAQFLVLKIHVENKKACKNKVDLSNIYFRHKMQDATKYITTIVFIIKNLWAKTLLLRRDGIKSVRGQKKVPLGQVCSLWAPPLLASSSRSSGLHSFHIIRLSRLFVGHTASKVCPQGSRHSIGCRPLG